ncbi:hypothetical protein [Paracoccus laeviglucosivorans]|uniref:Uncharacterized protein n=1 Tax=Paracoccus laeviglucosivorans TaxID=1197861 RepID=A0A521DBW3_9RHOB|nr:hypothetical protein [Paracoccus laeviglucosivorans]SMO69062.1 hypothetical protein SAMN06265221_10768 [Paracoccus laeviglucosivorans]
MSSAFQFLIEGVSAFYLGHSLVSPTLPEMMHNLMETPVEFQIINGAPLEWQWNESANAQGMNGREWLPTHPVDAFVMTERVPLAPTVEYHASQKYAADWAALAVKANPAVKLYLYETWEGIDDQTTGTTKTWREQIVKNLPLWESIADGVNKTLPEGTAPMRIIPAGQGMIRLHDAIERGEVPGMYSIRDFFRDDIHPTDAGFYYVALINYAVLTGESPIGAERNMMGMGGPYDTPSDKVADVLQRLAKETVDEFNGVAN